MTRLSRKSAQSSFFLIPQFTMLPFTGAIETLRLANQMLGYTAYQWRLASLDGGKVMSSSRICLEADTCLADERRFINGEKRPDMAIVCSGLMWSNTAINPSMPGCAKAYNRGITLGSLCTATHILAEAGLLNGKRCAIHWENLPSFAEAFPQVEVYADLYEVDSNIYTCAGGTASLDMMLSLIARISVRTSSTAFANSS